MEHRGPIRWYNPKLGDFQWREVPKTDERALQALDGSPCAGYPPEEREVLPSRSVVYGVRVGVGFHT